MDIEIRKSKLEDIAKLYGLYKAAVRHVGPTQYDADQINVWADVFRTENDFSVWLSKSDVIVALDRDESPMGFAGLEKNCRIASLYVAPNAMRQGVATAMLKHLIQVAESRGVQQLTAEASVFSKPLFEKQGFEVIELETVNLDGVPIDRYRMAKG